MRKHRFVSLFMALLITMCLFMEAMPAFAASMPYRITVDCTNNIVTVYSTLDDTVVRQMICSTGKPGEPTIHGNFVMPKRHKKNERSEWYKLFDGYGKYATRIKGNFLFHSYIFEKADDDTLEWESYAAMGTRASLGCVRLYIDDAKWIAENCFAGTKVKIYDGDKKYSFLKEILYEKTYTIDSGIPYERYVCIAASDDEMGYGSTGDDVKALQERMLTLGLYGGEANGVYDEFMVRAVKAIQSYLDMDVTGVADRAFVSKIMDDDAPSSTISTLAEGMEGPAVRSLQVSLTRLGLYTGTINGLFDADTAEAVKLFQRLTNEPDDGIASGVLQANMVKCMDKLDETYGDGNYAITFKDVVSETAVIDAKAKVNMREERDTDSDIEARLKPGTEVDVLDHGGDWSKIEVGGKSGYVLNKYLKFNQRTVLTPEYIQADAEHPAIDAYVEYDGDVISAHETVYGRVDTKDRLMVHKKPDSDSKVMFMLETGAIVKMTQAEKGWALIEYGGRSGYAKTASFTKKAVAELDIDESAANQTDIADVELKFAQVTATEGAKVYSAAMGNAKPLGTLAFGERAEIILSGSEWIQIRYDDGSAFIKSADVMCGTAYKLDHPDEYIAPDIDELSDDMDEISDDELPETTPYIVNTTSLNMRTEPDSASTVLRVLYEGNQIDVYAIKGEWAAVHYEGVNGFVMSKYIKPVED